MLASRLSSGVASTRMVDESDELPEGVNDEHAAAPTPPSESSAGGSSDTSEGDLRFRVVVLPA